MEKWKKMVTSLLHIIQLWRLFVLLLPLEEEEEEEEEDEAETWDDELEDFVKWLHETRKERAYPMFCLLLSRDIDQEVNKIINDKQYYRPMLAKITESDCCIVYFRNRHEARQHAFNLAAKPDLAKYHNQRATFLLHSLNVDTNDLPCLLFFQDPYRFVPLYIGNKSADEIIQLVRSIFSFVHKYNSVSPLSAVTRYKRNYDTKRGAIYALMVVREEARQVIAATIAEISKST